MTTYTGHFSQKVHVEGGHLVRNIELLGILNLS